MGTFPSSCKSGSSSKIRTWTLQIQSLLHYHYAKELYLNYGAASSNRTKFSPSSGAREHQLHQGGIKSIAIWFNFNSCNMFKSTRPFAIIASFIDCVVFSFMIIDTFFVRSLTSTFTSFTKNNLYCFCHNFLT